MRIGFDTSNFVARAGRYDGVADWHRHDAETRRRFNIPSMRNWLDFVADIGFDGLSIWTAHCWYPTASRQQIETIRDLGQRVGLPIYALSGRLGEPDPSSGPCWDKCIDAAMRLEAEFLIGRPGPAEAKRLLEQKSRGRRILAFRNAEAETCMLDIMARIDRCDWMGVSFDVGWAAIHGMNVCETLRVLGPHLMDVHLRDLKLSRGPLDAMALGDGDVGIEAVVKTLLDMKYSGWVTVGHASFDRDPLPEVATSVERLRNWIEQAQPLPDLPFGPFDVRDPGDEA